jgi:hypothetical protein
VGLCRWASLPVADFHSRILTSRFEAIAEEEGVGMRWQDELTAMLNLMEAFGTLAGILTRKKVVGWDTVPCTHGVGAFLRRWQQPA